MITEINRRSKPKFCKKLFYLQNPFGLTLFAASTLIFAIAYKGTALLSENNTERLKYFLQARKDLHDTENQQSPG